jgi:acetylglutamate kinase
MRRSMHIARVIMDALPYIRAFHGRTVVIKYGGNAMQDDALKNAFARSVVLLKYIGVNPVVVHGGGPQIGRMLDQLGIECQFCEGHRVTDDATMDVVEMVLAGKINKEIVNLLNRHGGKAVGISGKDGRLITAQRMEMSITKKDAPTEIIDLGKVGRVTHVETALIDSLERDGFIPVIAPIGGDEDGETYNINADYVAGAVAGALKAKRLILLTDVPGILDKEDKLIHSLTRQEVLAAMEDGTLRGGMLPKVKCCLEALDQGVEKAFIVDGRVENSVMLELFTTPGFGTEIVGQEESSQSDA